MSELVIAVAVLDSDSFCCIGMIGYMASSIERCQAKTFILNPVY
jgi:hypothetical protein